ncbi:MAG: hypothetical protein MSH10_03265 [Pygmaiobacter massiliensis]|nr:hypothetical protein [Pygmaiobacter massiliensis]
MVPSSEEILEIIAYACGPVDWDTKLIDEGLMDSYAFAVILAELDDLGVRLQPIEMDAACFTTPRALICAVQEQAARS